MRVFRWIIAIVMLVLIFAPVVLCYLCPSFTGYSMDELAELMWTDEEITDKTMENIMLNVLLTLHVGIAAVTCLSLVMRSIIGTLGSVGVAVWIYFIFGKLWTVFISIGVGVGIVVLPYIVTFVVSIFTDADAVKITEGTFSAVAGFALLGLGVMIYNMFGSAHWFIITLNTIYCVILIICIVLKWGQASEDMEEYGGLLEMQLITGMARAHNRKVSTDYGRNPGGFDDKRDAAYRAIEDEISDELDKF